jgi:fluoroacetyl-CoA thioesterase
VTIEDLKPGLCHERTITASEALAVPALGRAFGVVTDMPPVFATANMIALVEWTCVEALAPYMPVDQRTLGTHVDISHCAATPVGMAVTARVELVEIDDRKLRFKVHCRDETGTIGEGVHERVVVDQRRFMERITRKSAAARG